MQITLGSLFDGIGGFPLAGQMAGITPVWASEIEPFPIRVTEKRFPGMKHYGDIHAMNGADIEPVDVITFGSPCQDLSIAGKQAGLDGSRSSLFYEAVRIITEMRNATNGKYPRWAVWENVPGALSSRNGQDFRQVLEALVRVKNKSADVLMPENGKWLSAGEILGDGYSLAWRIIDAQYHGVAQRRRRVFVVVDLDGSRAGEVLFASEGVSGYSAARGKAWQEFAGGTADGAGKTGQRGTAVAFEPGAAAREGGHAWEEIAGTLRYQMGDNQTMVALDFNPTDSRIGISGENVSQTLCRRMATGGNQVPLVFGISSDKSNGMLSDNPKSGFYEADTSRTLDCSGTAPGCNQGGIAVVEPVAFAQNMRDEVRDLHNVAGALAANPGMKQQTFVAAFMGGQGEKARRLGYQEEMSPTLKAAPSGGNTAPNVVYAIHGNMIGREEKNGPRGNGINEDVCFTMNVVDRPAVNAPTYSIRPLINTEAQEEKTPALMARDHKGAPLVAMPSYCMTVGSYGQVGKEQTPTLEARGFKDPPVVGSPPVYSLDRAAFSQGPNAKFGISVQEDSAQTLTSQGPNAVAKPEPSAEYIIRRLIPLECSRLQGYPDGWTENLGTDNPTEDEIRFWEDVFEEHRKALGKSARPRSRNQIIKWLKNPRTDAAEYAAYGNSVAIPCVFFVLAGIVWANNMEVSE